jgi:hypothetical protein
MTRMRILKWGGRLYVSVVSIHRRAGVCGSNRYLVPANSFEAPIPESKKDVVWFISLAVPEG